MTVEPTRRPAGAGGFWLVAAMGTALSANTSWLFFGKVFRITDGRERTAMFAVLEVMFLALGWATRANVRRSGKPGAARNWAWALCGAAAYMAVTVSGPVAGIARVLLGPLMALVALHLALGIEVRAKLGSDTGTWAKIRSEVRERVLSRIGLGDDQRTALARTRDRARDRAARLATAAGWVPRRQVRLARAVDACAATLDAGRRAELVEQIATLRHVKDLTTADLPSPWARHGVRTEPDRVAATDGESTTDTALFLGDLTQPVIGPVRPTVTAAAIRPDSDPTAKPSPHPTTAPTANPTSWPPFVPSTPPSSDPPVKAAAVAEATAKKIAAARRRWPAKTQREIATAVDVSQRTVERAWPHTAPEPAADQHKTNGTPVPDLTTSL